MKIHHFSAATFCPLGGRLLYGTGSVFSRTTMPCHCLLLETDAHGLVLVDTGLGTADLADPQERLGAEFLLTAAPRLEARGTALHFVRTLGFSPEDVRHVLLTHMDLDHAGGLSDFPDAAVHVLADEHAAATARRTFLERNRYRPAQWQHVSKFHLHAASGESWRGFPSVRSLPGLPPEVLMIPLSGHTRGHACIAVERGDAAVVHAGDSYFHHSSVTRERDDGRPPVLAFYEGLVAVDRTRIADNHRRLHELNRDERVTLFCAHDQTELDALRG